MRVHLLYRAYRRKAFTLLELLVVVVIIGILALLMLARFASASEKSYQAVMQSDLRNFATARALHVAEDGAVPDSVGDIAGFSLSKGVEVVAYNSVDASSYVLQVGHSSTTTVCELDTTAEAGAHAIACIEDFASTEPEVNAAPVAIFTVSTPIAESGEPLTFTSESSDPNGDSLVEMWDFDGDGVTDATGGVVTHSFTGGEQTHIVTLTVRDPGGLESSTNQNVVTVAFYPVLYQTSGFIWDPERTYDFSIDDGVDAYIEHPYGVTLPSASACLEPAAHGSNHEVLWAAGWTSIGSVHYRYEVEYIVQDPADAGKRVGVSYGYYSWFGPTKGYGPCTGEDFAGEVEFRLISVERVIGLKWSDLP